MRKRLSMARSWARIRDGSKAVVHTGQGYMLQEQDALGRINYVPLRGITRFLRDTLWPTYRPPGRVATDVGRFADPAELEAAIDNAESDAGSAESNSSARVNNYLKSGLPEAPRWANAYTARQAGMMRGREVHEQLRDYARSLRQDRSRPTAMFEQVYPDGPLPQVVAVIKFFQAQQWRLLWAELPVFSRDWRFGTEIDLVGWCTITRRLILIELKTGYPDSFQQATAPMKRGFPLSDSPLYQAIVQLTTSYLLLEQQHPRHVQVLRPKLVVLHAPRAGEPVYAHKVSSRLVAQLAARLCKLLRKEAIARQESRQRDKRRRRSDRL